MGKRSTAVFRVLGVVIALLVVLYLLLDWSANSPAVPRSLRSQLAVGMAKEEVRSLLGKPRLTQTWSDGTMVWTYGHSWKWYALTVYFDSQGKMTEFIHDD